MTSEIALQAAKRLAKTESLIDSVLQMQKQNDRLIRYGSRIISTLMFLVVVTFVGAGYQSIKVGKNIASLLVDVSLLQEEVSEGIAEFRSEKFNLKTKNDTVVHN